ncbi:DUF2062 domain-containing protein [Hydrogenophaga sp.]|uniref:DUF2062 domain-containing protein n=1 Tax=Hydrogenophaga sp. TaxID=1904254 RepID=UPI0025BFBE56|nr:DUF2062 domain-containing protein [Hydrogenophaga sp.]
MKQKFKQWLPDPETVRTNRWLRWMGPILKHPRLWHFSRKGIAMGLALGIFFGLLIPVAQIPFAAATAVLLRANLPMAVASTLVTNPVTFGPVYYGAYQLGKFILNEPSLSEEDALKALDKAHATQNTDLSLADRVRAWLKQFGKIGKPLVVGLAIVATFSGLLVYFLASGLWTLKTRWARRQRLRKRGPGRHQGAAKTATPSTVRGPDQTPEP